MKEPKTIKGYISLMRRVELLIPSLMNGYEDVDDISKGAIKELTGSISNCLADININPGNRKIKEDE